MSDLLIQLVLVASWEVLPTDFMRASVSRQGAMAPERYATRFLGGSLDERGPKRTPPNDLRGG